VDVLPHFVDCARDIVALVGFDCACQLRSITVSIARLTWLCTCLPVLWIGICCDNLDQYFVLSRFSVVHSAEPWKAGVWHGTHGIGTLRVSDEMTPSLR
jgi:hypothetical protein